MNTRPLWSYGQPQKVVDALTIDEIVYHKASLFNDRYLRKLSKDAYDRLSEMLEYREIELNESSNSKEAS